jgi:hypothetical protein
MEIGRLKRTCFRRACQIADSSSSSHGSLTSPVCAHHCGFCTSLYYIVMAFPTVVADADPDPTTQIAWPTARPKRVQPAPQENSSRSEIEQRGGDVPRDIHSVDDNAKKGKSAAEPGRRHLSTWDLITLSISMGGAQVAWTVELGCA